jgi:tetratricopeptide (TPR) repeat protein
MIAKIKHRLPQDYPFRGRLLDRVIIWSAVLLVISVVGFGVYYYIDQEGGEAPPAKERVLAAQIQMFEQAVIEDPNNITNRLALGDIYLTADRFADAASEYEAALVINEESVLAQGGLGRAKIGLGDLAGATENFQKVIDKWQEEDISGELVESAYYYMGDIALRQGDPETAITQLTEATKIERSDSDAWLLLGTAYLQAGKLDEAEDALDQSVLFVPDFGEAYEVLAQVYDQKGATAEATYARGMLAYSSGDLDEAAKKLEEAVGSSPTLAQAWAGLGIVREMQGEKDAAIAAYQQAVHQDPENFNATSGLARLSASSGADMPQLPAETAGADSSESTEQGVTP